MQLLGTERGGRSGGEREREREGERGGGREREEGEEGGLFVYGLSVSNIVRLTI